jgi:3-oxoadipate enol-lactonase
MMVHTRVGRVGFDEAGAGAAVVLLHGFPHDRTLWTAQLRSPVVGARYVAPDLPGFGESDRLADPSLDAWADGVIALLDTLGVARAIVGGLSMGGYLALACWRRHPDRIGGLILADTRAGADTAEARARRVEMQALARTEGAGAIAERMALGMTGRTTRESRPEVTAALDTMMRRATPDALVDALQVLMDRPDATPTLATITVPTLILCGDEDVLTPVAESEAMHAAVGGSTLHIIRGAGHASNVEAPYAFNRLLSAFVTATIRSGQT